jgi:glyceraldehyde-3-phosphate dehydrogenase (NAD(P))
LLAHLPPAERLFSSCARRVGHAANRGSSQVDALEPVFALPHEDADLQSLLGSFVEMVHMRRTNVPYTHSHLHHIKLDLKSPTSRESVVDALRRAPRVRLAAGASRFPDTGRLQEFDRDLGRPRGDRPEVFVWEESVAVQQRSVFMTVDVDPDATPIPELIDAVRCLARRDLSPAEIMGITDRSLGIGGNV